MPRRTAVALLGALACAGLAAVTWALAFQTGIGHRADESALRAFATLQGTRTEWLAGLVASLCNLLPYALLASLVTGMALLTRGLRGATVVGLVLLAPNVVTQLLKRGLAEDRVAGPVTSAVHVGPVSWPSGHATAAMVLALCAVIAAPAGWRVVVAVAGALFAGAVAYAVVLLGWHFPSDAVGGFAVAGAGAGLGVAALSAEPEALRRPLAAVSLAVLAVAVLGALVLRVAAGLPTAGQQAAFLAGAGAILALGLLLAAGVAGAVSRPGATAALPSRWPRARG